MIGIANFPATGHESFQAARKCADCGSDVTTSARTNPIRCPGCRKAATKRAEARSQGKRKAKGLR